MMASVNKVILVGNLGADPLIRYMADGTATASINLATTDNWKAKDTGEKKSHTEWHRIVSFGRQAEIIGEYLSKGSQIYVEGRLRTRKWTDKDNIERYTTEVVAEKIQMLSSKQGNSANGNQSKSDQAGSAGGFDQMDDDIPFS